MGVRVRGCNGHIYEAPMERRRSGVWLRLLLPHSLPLISEQENKGATSICSPGDPCKCLPVPSSASGGLGRSDNVQQALSFVSLALCPPLSSQTPAAGLSGLNLSFASR